jgi:hypothetical protein
MAGRRAARRDWLRHSKISALLFEERPVDLLGERLDVASADTTRPAVARDLESAR